MLKNYFKSLFRALWRNRLFTLLNILGLSVCISVAWIVFRMVNYEYSFDKKIPGAEHIYQVVSRSQSADHRDGAFAGVSKAIVNPLRNEVSGVELVVPMFYKYRETVSVKNETDEPQRTIEKGAGQVATLPGYFNMLEYKWLAGDKNTALDAPDKVVLTEAKAGEYFPTLTPEQIVGKTIAYDDTLLYRVSAVVKAPDYPNSFSAENTEFIRIGEDELSYNTWGSRSSQDLVFIKPAKGIAPQAILDQLNAISLEHNRESFEKYNYQSWYEVLPLGEKHFAVKFGAQTRTANKKVLNGLMIVGAFLLLLACINYINLNTALLPRRAKEIGIRKSLGSSFGRLIGHFIGETLVITLLAAILAFAFAGFAVKIFADFLPEGFFEYVNYPGMIAFMLGLVLVISLLSGLYPAWLSARVNTVSVLKGVTEKVIGRHKVSLRKGLIVFQFLIAQIFIIGAIIVNQQLRYMLHKDLGFNKEAVITIDVPYQVLTDPAYKDKQFVLKEELSRNTAIAGVSLGDRPMEAAMSGRILSYYEGEREYQHQMNMKFGDTDYLKLYDFHLLAGRNFHASDTMSEIVINETALKAYGFKSPQDAIGELLVSPNKTGAFPIVGVVSDFHQFGLQSGIDPVLIATGNSYLNSFNIKLPLQPSKWNAAIKSIEKNWKSVYGSTPFEYRFYDETIAQFYRNEERTQKLVRAATGIAILISCLGLFGLATLTAAQRTKEIGIRKVLGASVMGMVGLLSREFVLLVLLSLIIAVPVAWWLMVQWLQNFAWRIELQWWMFALAGLLAVVIALLTVSFQSVKAALISPVKSLRSD